jgi:hypothetical protein
MLVRSSAFRLLSRVMERLASRAQSIQRALILRAVTPEAPRLDGVYARLCLYLVLDDNTAARKRASFQRDLD